MSSETLVVGAFKLCDGIEEKMKKVILSDAMETFECNIEYDQDYDEYPIEDVNWSSRIDEIKIDAFIDKWKQYFKHYYFSLYYLDEPYRDWCSDWDK